MKSSLLGALHVHLLLNLVVAWAEPASAPKLLMRSPAVDNAD